MSILHLIAPGPLAGAERLVLAGSRALQELGLGVTLGVIVDRRCARHGETFAAEARRMGIRRVERLTCRGRLDPRVSVAIRNLAATADPTLLHVHGYKSLIYALGAWTGLPLVATHHGNTAVDRRVRLYEALAMRLYRRADAVVAVSLEIRAQLLDAGISPRRIHRVPNCLALADPPGDLPGPGGERPTLLFLGRLSPEKGVDVLLDALASRGVAGVDLEIAGDGPERAALEAQAKRLGLPVTFHGFVSDVRPLLARCDAVVLPSRREGLPLVVIEAGSWGKPIIASRIGGIAEVVADGANGLLVPPEDPKALRTAVDTLCEDREGFAARAAVAAAEIRDRYSPARWAESTCAVYQNVLDRPVAPMVETAA